jgi:hypothetical protein
MAITMDITQVAPVRIFTTSLSDVTPAMNMAEQTLRKAMKIGTFAHKPNIKADVETTRASEGNAISRRQSTRRKRDFLNDW